MTLGDTPFDIKEGQRVHEVGNCTTIHAVGDEGEMNAVDDPVRWSEVER